MLHFGYSEMIEAVKDTEQAPPQATANELAEPRWSVVSFEKLEAASVSYLDAEKTLQELDKRGVSGLCIITDEAAHRLV